MRRILILTSISSLVLVLMFVYQTIIYSDNALHIVFCDVGQGDSIYIRTPDKKDIVIDGGANESSSECINRHMPFWDRTIDLVFMTHADFDHYGGLVDVFENYHIRQFSRSSYTSTAESFKTLESLVLKEKSSSRVIGKGDTFKISDISILTLWPPKDSGSTASLDDNNLSLVQLLKFRDFELLLTGDLDKEYLNVLLDAQRDIDVLKLSHHGSRTGTDSETFSHIKPELSIISAGRNNRYGHPHREVLEVLKGAGLKYKATLDGDVEIITDGERIRTL